MLRTVLSVCLSLAVSAGTAAAQKPAASFAGAWTLAVQGGDHVIPFGLTLEQKDAALTGVLTVVGNEIPVSGSVTAGAFVATGTGPMPLAPGSSHDAKAPIAEFTVRGQWAEDGTLTGSLTLKSAARTGEMKYTGERLKARAPVAGVAGAITDVSGEWTVNVAEAGLTFAMTLAQSGQKVTGSIVSDHLGTMAVTGTFVNGVFSFVSDGEQHGQTIHIEYTAKPVSATALAGDLTSSAGAMTFRAERVKK